jgi:ethanolamine permease
LRIKEPDMPRPYKTPGGIATSSTALILSLVALTGVYAFDPRAFAFTLALYAAGACYFFFYSRHQLVAKTAEEEFALLAAAELDLQQEEEIETEFDAQPIQTN